MQVAPDRTGEDPPSAAWIHPEAGTRGRRSPRVPATLHRDRRSAPSAPRRPAGAPRMGPRARPAPRPRRRGRRRPRAGRVGRRAARAAVAGPRTARVVRSRADEPRAGDPSERSAPRCPRASVRSSRGRARRHGARRRDGSARARRRRRAGARRAGPHDDPPPLLRGAPAARDRGAGGRAGRNGALADRACTRGAARVAVAGRTRRRIGATAQRPGCAPQPTVPSPPGRCGPGRGR